MKNIFLLKYPTQKYFMRGTISWCTSCQVSLELIAIIPIVSCDLEETFLLDRFLMLNVTDKGHNFEWNHHHTFMWKLGWQNDLCQAFHFSNDSGVCKFSCLKFISIANCVAASPTKKVCLVKFITALATPITDLIRFNPATLPVSCDLPSIIRASSVVSAFSSGEPPYPKLHRKYFYDYLK